MKTQTQPTNKDLVKAGLYILALFVLFVVVPFGHNFIDYFMNAVFKQPTDQYLPLNQTKMKTLTKENKNYIFNFVDNSEKPEGITVVYNTDGWYGGRHTVDVKIETIIGVIDITFCQDDIWGYVNSLGECKLNGKDIKVCDLIGYKYQYTTKESNLINIISAIWNVTENKIKQCNNTAETQKTCLFNLMRGGCEKCGYYK